MSSTSIRSLERMGARFEVTKTSAVRTMAASASRPGVVVKVAGDAALAAVGDLYEGVGTVPAEVEHVEEGPLRIAVGWLDLDDVGTQVGEHGAGGGDEGPVGDLDDAHSIQRTSHGVPDRSLPAATPVTRGQSKRWVHPIS